MTAEPTARVKSPSALSLRTVVLGLGNPLVADDSVGLRVIERLRPRLIERNDVEVDEDYCGGLRLMERLIGFDRAILVDAICSGAEPGSVRVLTADDVPSRHSGSAHDLDLRTALALGRQVIADAARSDGPSGAKLPTIENIRVVVIEAADVATFSEKCTPQVEAGIEQAAEAVLALLAAWR